VVTVRPTADVVLVLATRYVVARVPLRQSAYQIAIWAYVTTCVVTLAFNLITSARPNHRVRRDYSCLLKHDLKVGSVARFPLASGI